MVGVTRVTGRAVSSDELSEQDYRDIYGEIREKCSLRQFSEFIHSEVSFAWWGQFEKGEKTLSQDRKSELRRAVGLPALPLTVAQATASVDPDAVVWRLGEGVPDRVVLVGVGTHEPLMLRLNGDLRILEELGEEPVTGVSPTRRRLYRKHITIREQTWERLNAARCEAGLGWEGFLEQLLKG
jgi:hypothetical protein